MKIIDIQTSEVVRISIGKHTVVIRPLAKSGRRVRLGIDAPTDVFIGNAEPEKQQPRIG